MTQPRKYQPTAAEVDEAREAGQAAALRNGSVEECPHRLFGSDDKPRSLALARLWMVAFDDARAWMREQA